MTRVLIAVDETEASVHAARVAHRLFGDDAEYFAVSVVDPGLRPDVSGEWWPAWGVAYPVPWGTVWPYQPAGAGTEDATSSAEDAAAREARVQAERSGLEDAVPVGEVGDPATAILEVAHARAVDVIVVGSHERSWLSRLFRPSVALDVAKHADIPVLIAK